jgi:cyclic pyranopterin phosphate synthase
MKDKTGRVVDYMRVSVTDRCNLNCNYCMPRNYEPSKNGILKLDEILRICKIAARSEIGIKKIKITGGEPLLRKNVTDLIAKLKKTDGIDEVTLTTNGVLLEDYASELFSAGVDKINVSLDSLNREHYCKITGSDSLDKVLRGISAVRDKNIPIAVNTVLQRDINENDFFGIVTLAKNYEIDVRFIEMMPIGEGRSFSPVLTDEIIGLLDAPIKPIDKCGNGPAIYYSAEGYKGKIGFVSAISNRFCERCNRIRLTYEGFLKGCLCYKDGVDLTPFLAYNDDNKLASAIKGVIYNKPKGHSFENLNEVTEARGMNKIGG